MRPRQIKAVLFDLDGTLIDSLEEALRVLNQIFRKYANKEITLEHFQTTFRMPFEEWYREQGVTAPFADVLAHWSGAFEPSIAIPFPDTHETLLRLAGAGLPLGVISGSSMEVVTSHLTRHGFDAHISYVHGGDSRKVARMHDFCEQLNLVHNDVAYVGDSVSDIHDAVEAGLVPIGIVRKVGRMHHTLMEAGAEIVITSLLELPPLVGVLMSRSVVHLK